MSATTLWTLHNRGTEAKRSDGVIRDPWAVTLLDAISYDYLKFGKPDQWHALRAVAFDAAARQHPTAHPKAAVVALAEGLQTSLWAAGPGRRSERIDLVFGRFAAGDGSCVSGCLPKDDRIVAAGRSRHSTAAGWTWSIRP